MLDKFKKFLLDTFCPYSNIKGYSKEENCHNCKNWDYCDGIHCQWEEK